MSLRRTALLAVALGILVTPALALPNNGAFNKSSEAFKLTFQDLCNDIATEADGIEHSQQDSPIPPDKTKSAQDKRAAEQLREKARGAGCKI